MKNILFLIAILIALTTEAQTSYLGGKNSTVEYLGGLAADSAFAPPKIDTSKTQFVKGISKYQIAINSLNNHLMYHDQYGWVEVGTSTAGLLAIGTPVTGGSPNSFLYENSSSNFTAGNTSASFAPLVSDATGASPLNTSQLVFSNNPTLNGITILNGANIDIGSAAGTIIASASSQKMGFWGTTPITRPNSGSLLTNLALMGLQFGNTILENEITFTDITTGNSSTSKHGYLAKLDNTATHYMDGTGNWSAPTGSGVTSVSGTSNQITSSGSTTPVIALANNAAIPGSPTTTTQSLGDATTKIATTAFVSAALAGVNPAVAVQVATTANVTNLAYSNGASGIGATLTQTVAAVVTIDGYTPVLLDRVLFKNQTTTANNGVYFISTLGTGIIPAVFTRALDYDQPSDMNNTGSIPVINGTANATTSWVQSSTVNTVGSDPVTFTQFSYAPSTLITTSTGAGGSLTGTYPNPTIATIPSGATATTQTASDNSTKVATTAYVNNLIQTVEVSVSSSDLLNVSATPKTLIAAQGVGTIIIVQSAYLVFTYVSTTYSAGTLRIIENATPATGATIMTASPGINAVTSSYNGNFIPVTITSTAGSIQLNQPVQLWSSTAPTTGDGTMKIILTYTVYTP